MKKIIFFLALIFMASVSYLSAQNFVQSNQQDVTLGTEQHLPANDVSRADYTLKYYAGTTFAGLGNAGFGVGTFYSHGCISFTSAQMYNYAGGTLSQINFYFPAASQNLSLVPSSGKVWIKNSLSGAILYEQSCTVTPGAWNNVPLTTTYPLTTNGLVIGFSVTHTTTSGTANEIRPMPLTTTGDSYKTGGVNYIIGATVPNTNGAGATWNIFNSAGNLVIEGLVTGAPALPTNDLSTVSVSTGPLKWVGSPSTFTVAVYNSGTASQNNYSVQIIDAANNVLGTQAVTTALASGAFADINVTVTPAAAGNLTVRGKVILIGDAVSGNDITDPVTQKVYPQQPLAYCTSIVRGFLTAAAAYIPSPLNAAIGYPSANITPFVGKRITAIDLYIDAPPSVITDASVWVRSSLSGTNLAVQTFTPVEGWNSVTLTTPYDITNVNTFIGFTYTVTATGCYPMAISENTQNAANGGHYLIGATGTWGTLASVPPPNGPYPGNWAIIGVVSDGAPPADCNPATNLVVNYTNDCKADLTWDAPTGKSATKITHTQKISLAAKRDELMAHRKAHDPNAMPLRTDLINENFDNPGDMYDLPAGWTETTEDPDSWWWMVLDEYEYEYYFPAHSGEQFATVPWDDEYDRRAWMFTPAITMAAGTTYHVSFWLMTGYEPGDGNNIKVKIAQVATPAAMNASSVQVFAATNLYTNDEWMHITYDFTPTTAGTYYIGFNDYTDAYDGEATLLDDVVVSYEGAPTPGDFTYNIYRDGGTTPIATVTTESYTDQTFLATAGHTWEVKVVCDGGGESDPSNTVTKPACNPGTIVCDDVICGTGTSQYYDPLPGWYGWNRSIMLFEASELGGAGNITELAFEISQVSPTAKSTKFYLMQTSATTLDAQYVWNTIKAQATLVYDHSIGFPTAGWQTFTLDNSFAYDGTQNLLVLVEGIGCSTSGGCSTQCRYSTKTNCHWYSRQDGTPPNDAGLAGTRNSNRPNVTFTVCTGSGPGPCTPTDVTIGNGATGQYQPVLRYYVHSYGQYIYYAADLGGAGTISSLAFADAEGAFHANNITVWLGNTTKTEFLTPTTSEFIPLGQMEQVFHGSVTGAAAAGWLTIGIDDFNYTGGNLVVAIHNSQAPYLSPGTRFKNTSTGAIHKSIQTYSDTDPIDPANPVMYGSGYIHYLYSPDIKFDICVGGTVEPGDCDPVTDVQAQYVNGCDVELTWTPPGKKSKSAIYVADQDVEIPSLQISPAEAAKEALEGNKMITVKAEKQVETNMAVDMAPVELLGMGSQITIPQGEPVVLRDPTRGILWNNGPYITHPGGGAGGVDASAINDPYSTTYGFNINKALDFSIADDFTLTAPSTISDFEFYTYQTSAGSTTSTITGAYCRIWNGAPNAGGTVVWGDLTTNRIGSVNTYADCNRVTLTALTNTDRRVMKVTANVGTTLDPGTYWVEWALTGSIASGPWAVPKTILGAPENGNALQYVSGCTWKQVSQSHDLMFIVNGTENTTATPAAPTAFTATPSGASCNLSWTNPTQTVGGAPVGTIANIIVLRNGVTAATLPGTTTSYTDNPTNAGTYIYSVHAVNAAGAGAKVYSNPVNVGTFCQYTFEVRDSYGDSWNDAAIGITIDGLSYGAIEHTDNTQSWVTKTKMLPSGNIEFFWIQGLYDDECEFKIYNPDGEMIFTVTAPTCLSWTPCYVFKTYAGDCGDGPIPGDMLYNVYCDGTLVVGGINEPTYTYGGFDPTASHEWCITVACEGGGESAPACVGLDECGCPAPSDLQAQYLPDCSVELTWTAPSKKNIRGSGSITTQPAGNGYGAIGVDVTAGPEDVTITQLQTYFNLTGTATVHVYYRTGTICGHMQDPAGWTLLGQTTATITGSGSYILSNVFDMPGVLTIPAGQTYGIYLGTFSGPLVCYYNGGTVCGATTAASNGDLTLKGGTAITSPPAPFGGASAFSERIFAGTIFYNTGAAPGSYLYNIYCDGNLVIADHDQPTYTYNDFDPMTDHEWCIETVCPDGSVSDQVCASLIKCICDTDPIENLQGEYQKDCELTLTWDAPGGKKAPVTPKTPEYIEPTATSPNLTPEEKEAMEKSMELPSVGQFATKRPSSLLPNNLFTELPINGGTRGNTAYAWKHYPSPQGYISFDVDNITGYTMVNTTLPTLYGGDVVDGILYAHDEDNIFYRVNSTTGAIIQQITPPSGTVWLSDMSYDYIANTMYGVKDNILYTVNLATGGLTQVASLSLDIVTASVRTFAINLSGNAFVVATDGNFYSVNKSNGQCTLVGSTGQTDVNYAQSMTFDHNTNILYWAHSGNVNDWWRTINPTTGQATFLANAYEMTCPHIPYQAGDPCDAISGLNANVVNNNNVALTWTAAPGSPTGYQVIFNGTTLTTVTTTSYTHNNVPTGAHNYCVKALYTGDCIPQSVCTSVTVYEYFGDCIGKEIAGGTTGTYEIPLNTFYKFSYVQEIIDASLIGDPGIITQIAFNFIKTSAITRTNQTIYLAHTNKTEFTGTSDWIPISEFTQVFTGTINYNNANAWFNIELNEPFEYTGGNLVIAYLNNHGAYEDSNPTFYMHTTTGYKTISYRKDDSPAGPLNPATPPTANERRQNRSNIRFVVCPGITYNVYLDNVLHGTSPQPYYVTTDFDNTESHVWTVRIPCEDGGESFPVSIEMSECIPCNPIEGLEAVYDDNCNAILTINPPIGKGMKLVAPVRKEDPNPVKAEKPQPVNTSNYAAASATMGIPTIPSNDPKGPNDWIKWCGPNIGDGIGATSPPSTFSPGARFLPSDLAAMDVVSGDLLTKVRIFIYSGSGAPNVFTLNIYQGGTSPTNPGTLAYTQPLTGLIDGSNEITLTTPLAIDASQELWVTYQVVQNSSTNPAGMDAGPRVPDKGDIFCDNGSWDSFYNITGGYFNLNWNIEAFIITGNVNIAAAPTNFTVTPVGTLLKANLAWKNPTTTFAGAPLTSINNMVVKRNGATIATLSPAGVGANMTYTDNTIPAAGTYNYSVHAVTSEGDGMSANVSNVLIGDMCNLTFVMSDDFGDGWNGAKITVKVDGITIGEVTCPSGPIYPATATAQLLVPSGELTLTWTTGSYDMECYVEVRNPQDELIFVSGLPGYWQDPCAPGIGMCNMAGVFHTSQFSCGGSSNHAYNIYLDGELIEENYEGGLVYIDNSGFDPYIEHTWTVTVVCEMEEFGESDPVSVTLPACKCREVENLMAVYTENCDAVLTWDAPDYGKKSGTGVIFKADVEVKETIPFKGEKSQATDTRPTLVVSQTSIPAPKGPDDYIKWTTGVIDGSLGNGTYPIDMIGVARFTPVDLGIMNVVSGDLLTKVKFGIQNAISSSYVIKIYQGSTSLTNPGTLVHEQTVTQSLSTNSYNEVILTTSYAIDASQELWIGVHVISPTPGYYLGTDAGPCISAKGDIYCWNGEWLVVSVSPGLFVNWNIEAFVATGNPNLAAAPDPFNVTPIGTSLKAKLTWENPTTTIGGDPLTSIQKMVVERDGVQIWESAGTVTPGQNMTYTDNAIPSAGDHCYSVYAVTSEGNGSKATQCGVFGNMCEYTFEMWDSYGDGWDGAAAIGITVDGTSFGTVKLASGAYGIATKLLPAGEIQFSWIPGPYDSEISFKIFDFDGIEIYNAPTIPWPIQTVFLTYASDCGGAGQMYNIYCDGVLIEADYPDTYYLHTNLNPFLLHTWCVEASCMLDELSWSDPVCVSIDTICGPKGKWLVFGVVKMADNNFIVGADLTLEDHWNSYATNSVAYGVFEFTDVYETYNSDPYVLTVSYPRFQTHIQNVEVLGHKNLGTIILLEIPEKPTNVAAADAGNYAAITWAPPTLAPITGIGYKVYRLLPGQENNPDEWVTLTNTPVPALYYNDNAWATLPTGIYKWAVRTCYAGGVISEPEFSTNTLSKVVTVPYTIRVITNSGDLPTGAEITLTGPQTYNGISGVVGITFDNIEVGTYTLKITLTGFNNYETTFEITAPGTYTAQLIETINDPYNAKIELVATGALFTWSHDALKPFLGFTVYLNGVVKAVGVTDKEYLFTGLANGTYTAGVQANYASGNSAIVEEGFVITGIDTYENDFGLYPNPTQDFITVERATTASATIELYNAMGAHIQTYETIETKFEIDVRTLAAGTYFIRVIEDDFTAVKSFVKK
jgi:hypothetical protein